MMDIIYSYIERTSARAETEEAYSDFGENYIGNHNNLVLPSPILLHRTLPIDVLQRKILNRVFPSLFSLLLNATTTHTQDGTHDSAARRLNDHFTSRASDPHSAY